MSSYDDIGGDGAVAAPTDAAAFATSPNVEIIDHDLNSHQSASSRIPQKHWDYLERESTRFGLDPLDIEMMKQQLDPFADIGFTPATPASGQPSVPVVVTQTINIGAPAGLPAGKKWMAQISSGPTLNKRLSRQTVTYGNMISGNAGNREFGETGPVTIAFGWDGDDGGAPPLDYNAYPVDGQEMKTSVPSIAFDPLSSDRLPFATAGNQRASLAISGAAMEIAETSPVINRGGLGQSWRSTFATTAPEITFITNAAAEASGSVTNYQAAMPVLGLRSRMPPGRPSVIYDADPQARATQPADGFYHVFGLVDHPRAIAPSTNLNYLGDDPRSTADNLDDGLGATGTPPVYYSVTPRTYGDPANPNGSYGTYSESYLWNAAGSAAAADAESMCQRTPDIASNLESSGVLLSGLTAEQTFSVTLRVIIFAVPTGPAWMPFTKSPRAYDPRAFYLTQYILHHLPRAAPLSANATGSWFRDVIGTFKSAIGHVLPRVLPAAVTGLERLVDSGNPASAIMAAGERMLKGNYQKRRDRAKQEGRTIERLQNEVAKDRDPLKTNRNGRRRRR